MNSIHKVAALSLSLLLSVPVIADNKCNQKHSSIKANQQNTNSSTGSNKQDENPEKNQQKEQEEKKDNSNTTQETNKPEQASNPSFFARAWAAAKSKAVSAKDAANSWVVEPTAKAARTSARWIAGWHHKREISAALLTLTNREEVAALMEDATFAELAKNGQRAPEAKAETYVAQVKLAISNSASYLASFVFNSKVRSQHAVLNAAADVQANNVRIALYEKSEAEIQQKSEVLKNDAALQSALAIITNAKKSATYNNDVVANKAVNHINYLKSQAEAAKKATTIADVQK